MMPYTATEDIASTSSTPTGGSATWRCVKLPHQLTTPSLSVKLPPTGTTTKVRNAGTSERYGASRNTRRRLSEGSKSSLKKSFTPSARVWRMPNGPATAGPMRFCMSLMSLRSNQIMSVTLSSKKVNATSTLMATIATSSSPTPPRKRGSTPKIMRVPHLRC